MSFLLKHPQSNDIYKMLDEVDRLLEMAGHVPDTSEVHYEMDEELKEGKLSQHSEKLAIAFGLISTKPGTTLRIVKNLRVCGNCHEATKLISKIFNREILQEIEIGFTISRTVLAHAWTIGELMKIKQLMMAQFIARMLPWYY
ncbi:pentatricopeptide repeat-containing protein At1g08070, chloroplastic-like [Lycium ferocissimum]|uniref:pentatricopeptide repeat-containing protein At1g08070, chloroplastic-like n=1 Tax=Lycium ferocissimum TaxID=112874 RepID=UPI002816984A|nr:pentatricopeptide repeat-containing protein At1g08070, chloroplastic-like [Lycium ferocissimum]